MEVLNRSTSQGPGTMSSELSGYRVVRKIRRSPAALLDARSSGDKVLEVIECVEHGGDGVLKCPA